MLFKCSSLFLWTRKTTHIGDITIGWFNGKHLYKWSRNDDPGTPQPAAKQKPRDQSWRSQRPEFLLLGPLTYFGITWACDQQKYLRIVPLRLYLGRDFDLFRTQTNAVLPTKMHSQRISGASGSQIVRTSHLISNGQGPSEASASARAVATPPNGLTWDLTILKNPLGLHSPFLAVRWILNYQTTRTTQISHFALCIIFISSRVSPAAFWSCLQDFAERQTRWHQHVPLVEPLFNVGWLNWPCPVIRMDNEQLKIGEVKQSCTCLSFEHASGILMSTRIQQVFVCLCNSYMHAYTHACHRSSQPNLAMTCPSCLVILEHQIPPNPCICWLNAWLAGPFERPFIGDFAVSHVWPESIPIISILSLILPTCVFA
jgi:hypothetical protein